MICYRPFELHNHTQHSDGQFTVSGLMKAAAAYGYAGIALTDHNAVTGNAEVTHALETETGLRVIPGIEWTTFYGHLLVLGCDRFIDWRFVTPDTIDTALQEIADAHGVAGVAHPREVGSPLMCGCNWEFRVTRWDLVSYIEVWSQEDPMSRTKNQLVMPWYDGLLNQGHRLAVSAGRDWHAPDSKAHLLTATYLGLPEGEVNTPNTLVALRDGRTYITLGPTVDLTVWQEEGCFGLGETASARQGEVRVQIGLDERRAVWEQWNIEVKTVRLVVNGETAAEQPFTGAPISFSRELPRGWLRAELRGSHARGNGDGEIIALTSPIYLA